MILVFIFVVIAFRVLDNLKYLPEGKKIFFASDFHLGVSGEMSSADREKKIVKWLDSIEEESAAIFLVGDIFDFWFEYKYVIPKGFVRLQGKLAALTDRGIPVIFFTGNHDMWMFDYFPKEFNIPVYREPQVLEVDGKKIMVGHGDGLGPGDRQYKILKKIFANRFCQWLFSKLHPNLGIRLANYWSGKSRISNSGTEEFKGEEEWLLKYCQKTESEKHHDYYIFGHRHLPLDININDNSRYINLGEWVNHFTYGELDKSGFRLLTFEN